MRVIVINPWDQTICEAEHNGDFRDYYRLLSGPTIDGYADTKVSCFTMFQVGDPTGHVMFVEDAALLDYPQAYFYLRNTVAPSAGRGVIVKSDGENEIDATLSIDQLRPCVGWW